MSVSDPATARIVVYTTEFCPYCDAAKALLKKKGLDYHAIDIAEAPHLRDEIVSRSGRRTLPQIFIDNNSIGGFDQLRELDKSGELDKMLTQN